ncbi:MAG: KEOPS complex kinase/ATPase Bud32 [Candidatus Pacearchaeota archaeon]
MEIIAKGAEAVLMKKEVDILVKRRIGKGYRIKEIDEKLRKLRTRQEARLLEKAAKVTNVPKVLNVDEVNKEVVMQFIPGKKLSEELNNLPLKQQEEICKKIGEEIAKLHDLNIIHGDLTTSNILLKEDKIYFIDFGLGFISSRIEDKAVDLHLLKEALEAKHFMHWKLLFEKVLEEYKKSQNSEKVIKQFEKVEKRGRYKH